MTVYIPQVKPKNKFSVYLKHFLHIIFSILNSKYTKPCALAFYFLWLFRYSASFSEMWTFNEKVLQNRMATDQYILSLTKLTLCQNLKKIEQNPRFKNSVLCTKFVQNPSWRKRFFKFLRLLLFSPNSYFHNQQLFGFLV